MRLIDADALMGTVFNDVVLIDGEVKGAGIILAETVDGAATVDAVPVVRCKDCKSCRKLNRKDRIEEAYAEGVLWCKNQSDGVWPDDFCSYGERKDGKTDA